MGLYCSRSGFDEGSRLLCSQIFAQLTAQRQAHANAHTGDRGDILGTEAHTAGVSGSVQALDGLIILVQHLLVIGGHKAAGGHQCKAQTRGGDMGVEGSLPPFKARKMLPSGQSRLSVVITGCAW